MQELRGHVREICRIDVGGIRDDQIERRCIETFEYIGADHRHAITDVVERNIARSQRQSRVVDIREHDLGIRKRVRARDADTPRSGAKIENTIGKTSQPRRKFRSDQLSDRSRTRALQQELARELAEVRGDLADLARLEVRAPFDGELLDVDTDLAPGTWVRPSQPLGIVVALGEWVVDAYVDEAALARIEVGARARFHPQGEGLTRIEGRVESIDTARATTLPHPLLAVAHGGVVETTQENGKLAPRASLYRVRIVLDAPPPSRRMDGGNVVIEGQARSPAVDWLRRAAAVLVRESGF